MQKGFLVSASLMALAAAPQAARASAFAIDDQNARAMGAAYAGAQARRADAGYIFYNPASIAGLKAPEFSSSSVFFWGPSRYRNASAAYPDDSPVAGLHADGDVLPPAWIPSSAVAAPLTDRLAVGLAINSPFGLHSTYAVNSVLRYHAMSSKLFTAAFSPTVAYALTDKLSIGASLRIEYAELTLTSVTDAGGIADLSMIPGFSSGSSDLFSKANMHDVGIGFSAGAEVEPVAGVRFGFNYTSRVTHDLEGDAKFDIAGSPAATALNASMGVFAPTHASTSLPLPATFSVGASLEASPRVTLLASATVMRWSGFRQIAFTYANPAQPTDIATFFWRDAWSFSGGAEYRLNPSTTLRIGYKREDSPVNLAFATPRIADSPRNWIAGGMTFVLSDKISADIAAEAALMEGLDIVRDGTLPEDMLRGAISVHAHGTSYAVSSRLRYKF